MPTPDDDLITRLGQVRSPHLSVDIDAIVADGRRRTVRRRVATLALAACFVVLAGVGFLALRPGGFLGAEPLPPAVPSPSETMPAPDSTSSPDDTTPSPDDGVTATPAPTQDPPDDGMPAEVGWVADVTDSLELPGIDLPAPGDGQTQQHPDVVTIAREAGDTSTTVTFEGGPGRGEPIPLREPMLGFEYFQEGDSVLVLWPMAPEEEGHPTTVNDDGGTSSLVFGGWDVPSVELGGQTLGYRYFPRVPEDWDVTDVVVEAAGGSAVSRYTSIVGDDVVPVQVGGQRVGAVGFATTSSDALGACGLGGGCQVRSGERVLWSLEVDGAHVGVVRLPAGVTDVRGVAEGGGLTAVGVTAAVQGEDFTLVTVVFALDGDYAEVLESGEAVATLEWVDADGQPQELDPEEVGPPAGG